VLSRRPPSLAFVLVVSAAAAAAVGCARAHPDPSVGDAEPAQDGGASTTTTTAAQADASASATAAASGTGDASASPAPAEPSGPFIIAHGIQAPIYSASEFPPKDPTKAAEERQGVIRLGYLRRGSRASIKPGVISKSNCAEGWYELTTGGFVCGKYATTDPNHKELRFAPHAPWLDRPLPYDYGLNLTPGTPLYRRIPLKRERKEHERTLAIGKHKKSSDIAKEMQERGEELPAYLKDVSPNAKPKVGFDDLKGESDLIATRMLKGFYLSLDKKIDGRSGVFWHTTSGFLAPKDHIIVHEPKTEFQGVRFDAPGETRRLPLAWVVGTKAKKYELDLAGEEKSAKQGDKVDRFSILSLSGKKQRIKEHLYWETKDGYWMRDDHVAVVEQPPVASGVAPGEKWIDVDLSGQALVAFEGEKPVFATVVSTGRHSSDPEKDHKTPEGSFRVREKHVTTTMDDDGSTDGTYRIEDVPWVMYFEKSYALHGAFWHSSFGRERSHGCVNLTPGDARFIFTWVGPTLPDGWHGVRATKDNAGTRVVVHK